MLQVTGTERGAKTQRILALADLRDGPHYLRVTGVFFAIEGGSVRLYWEGKETHSLLMPLEGRGSMQLDWCSNALADPLADEGTGGVILEVSPAPTKQCLFSLAIEFAKQRRL